MKSKVIEITFDEADTLHRAVVYAANECAAQVREEERAGSPMDREIWINNERSYVECKEKLERAFPELRPPPKERS